MPSGLYLGNIVVPAISLVTERVSSVSAALTITGAFLVWSMQKNPQDIHAVHNSSTHP